MARANLLNTETRSFLDLVGNGKVYRVPPYQRDYSWSDEQWEDLWKDISDLQGQPDQRHYMGAVVLEGKTDRWEDRYLFNHVCRWPTGADPGDFRNVNFSVRNQKYRYVAAQGGGGATKGKGKDKGKKGAPAAPRGPELFDMETDPGQTTNVIDRHPEIAAQMKAAFDHYWTEAIPLMINEKAPMSPTKPYHEWYREQEAAGGIPEWVAPAL